MPERGTRGESGAVGWGRGWSRHRGSWIRRYRTTGDSALLASGCLGDGGAGAPLVGLNRLVRAGVLDPHVEPRRRVIRPLDAEARRQGEPVTPVPVLVRGPPADLRR